MFRSALLLSLLCVGIAQGQSPALRSQSDVDFLTLLQNRITLSPSATNDDNAKCSFPLMTEAARRMHEGSTELRAAIQRSLRPAAFDTSIVSASGRFRVYFDLTGPNAAALLNGDTARIPGTSMAYALKIAEFFDTSYQQEVMVQGYTAPPLLRGLSEYQVFIIDYHGSFYGETIPIEALPPTTAQPTYATYIQVDNDFLEYKTKGLKAAKVTAAHEFHHALQLGTYGWWFDHSWFYEMTSTYFEEAVFPDGDDYLLYMKDFFKMPERSLYNWRGYECALFPLMMEARLGGFLPLRRAWDAIKTMAPLPALEQAITEAGSRLDAEYCEFARWNYYTNYRSELSPTQRYTDAQLYPRVTLISMPLPLDKPLTFSESLPPLASRYYSAVREFDTLTFAVTNVDLASARIEGGAMASYTLEISASSGGNDWHPFGKNYWYRFSPSQANLLCLSNFSGEQLDLSAVSVFPNPWNPAEGGDLVFPLSRTVRSGKAVLTILSTSMVPVYQKEESIQRDHPVYGTHIRLSEMQSLRDLPSGIYFFHLDLDDGITGKIAVVRQ